MNALQSITSRAAESRLRFLVGGGHAVIAHGHQRTTFDVDLIISRDDRTQWVALAISLGYSVCNSADTFIQFNPESKGLPLDLMLVNAQTFEKLAKDAIPAPASVGDAKIVSLRHLLALKCHAIKHGHAGRIVKDADDVIRLCLINRLDLDDREIREIFLKYGTTELYEKTKRVCKQQ